ncbi:MAG: FAD:protein FMN transferase [Planctomycetota bacterium]
MDVRQGRHDRQAGVSGASLATDAAATVLSSERAATVRERRTEDTTTLARAAMGTVFEVLIAGTAPGSDAEADPLAAAEAALDVISDWHQRCNRYDPASIVSHVNRIAPHARAKVDKEFAQLLTQASLGSKATASAFDFTAGSPKPDHNAVWADTDGVEFRRPDIAIDLGGIAKGWAIDAATDLLRELGVTRALIHGGRSSFRAIGGPWPINIEHDITIQLENQALSVSAPHHRNAHGETDLASPRNATPHVIDPRTGKPAPNPPAWAAAIMNDDGFPWIATTVDIWSTGLLVLHPIEQESHAHAHAEARSLRDLFGLRLITPSRSNQLGDHP